MKFNNLIFALLFITMFSFVNAYEPHKQNTDLEFSFTSNNATSCNVTTANTPNGIIIINQESTKSGQTFNNTINGGNFSSIGNYCFNIVCSDGIENTGGNVCKEVTLSGEVNNSTVLVSNILLLLTIMGILIFISSKHQKVDFEKWDKNIIKNHKNMGQTLVNGLLYTLFKNSFIWVYFLGWLGVLVLKEIVYNFNSYEVYGYFTLIANLYSLGFVLVGIFLIGLFASYIRGVIEILSDNNWGLGNEE